MNWKMKLRFLNVPFSILFFRKRSVSVSILFFKKKVFHFPFCSSQKEKSFIFYLIPLNCFIFHSIPHLIKNSRVNLRSGDVVKITIVEHELDVLHDLFVCTVIAEIELRLDLPEVHRLFDDVEIVRHFARCHWFEERP